MLNEKLEHNLYLKVFQTRQASDANFIKLRLLGNGLSGLRHILEIIARGRIEKDYDADKIAKDLWLWLDNFKNITLKSLCDSKSSNSTTSELYKKLYWKISSLQGTGMKNPFRLDECGINDTNKIYFKSIIADAYEAGPLKEYVLLAKSDFFADSCAMHILKHTNDNNFESISSKDADYLLKLTATFLIEKQKLASKNINVNSLQITFSNVLNWSCLQKMEGDFILKDSSDKNVGNPLYTKIYFTNSINKYFKIKFNKTWLDNFKIIDANDLPVNKCDFNLIYTDNGPNNLLNKASI